MTLGIYGHLGWLPRPPDDFAGRCRALLGLEGDLGVALRQLAEHALDENQLHRLARAIEAARQAGRSLAPLQPFRLGLVSNATTDLMVPVLVASAARHGIALECIAGAFDQTLQEALQPDSKISRARCEAVLVALDHRGLPVQAAPGDGKAEREIVAAAFEQLTRIREGMRRNGGAFCILQTIARPPEALFGSLDLVVPGTLRRIVDQLNRRIADSIPGTEDLLLDVAGLAETVGLAEWHDPTFWNLAKMPFASKFLPLYGEHVGRLLGALRGKSRRCLVLDLDNTLWSGVIGDDGIEGIRVAQGDPVGEAHLALQRAALALRERGIVLAVSSKNEDDIARAPFRQHPDMLLREDHIAVFQANWNDKATNIAAVAKELSLGLESLAFLDDNPAERALIRQALPQIAVPELPEDPALYARMLSAAGCFEAVSFSDEDRRRAALYQDNARRVSLQNQTGDLEAYLASLGMEITFQPFDDTGRARIAQLIAKSNQFNLTTRRYSEADVARLQRDPQCLTLQVRLSDVFGDNGMISVVICRKGRGDWTIDTWLMSCRVLGRRVENAVLEEILGHARRAGARRLIGVYIPTPRNKLVEEHYAKLGFALLETAPDGRTTWALEVADPPNPKLPIPMRIHRPEHELADA